MKKILLVLFLSTLVLAGCKDNKKVELVEPIIGGEVEIVNIARKEDKYGLISENNDEILPFVYEDLEYTVYDYSVDNSKHFIAKENGKYGVVNNKGSILIPCDYDNIEYIGSDWAVSGDPTIFYYKVKKNGKWGLVNQKNEILVDMKYDEIADKSSYSPALLVKVDNKWGAINLNNFVQTISCKYDKIDYTHYFRCSDYVSDSRCKFSDNGGKTWGIISADDGRILLDCIYEEIKEDADLADYTADDEVDYNIVKKNGKWGVLDKNNNTIIALKYDMIYSPALEYNGGTFYCEKDGKWGLLSAEGEELFGFENSSLEELEMAVLNAEE